MEETHYKERQEDEIVSMKTAFAGRMHSKFTCKSHVCDIGHKSDGDDHKSGKTGYIEA